MSELHTVEDVKKVLPVGMHKGVTEHVLDIIKSLGDDTGIPQEYVEEAIITSIPSLKNLNKPPHITKYIEALKYIMLKQRCSSNAEAWKLAFPEKYQRLLDNGITNNKLQGTVSVYNKRPIVVAIEADMMVAMHIQYAGLRHKAMVKAFRLMNGVATPTEIPLKKWNPDTKMKEIQYDDNGEVIMDLVYQAVSPKVQLEAASLILDKTDIPVTQEIELKIGMSEEVVNANNNLADALRTKAEEQRRALLMGGSIDDVQVIGTIIKENGHE